MPDSTAPADSVNVERIMEQIRARIREKRGVDYTELQVRELGAVKLESLLERFRAVERPGGSPQTVDAPRVSRMRQLLRRVYKRLLRPVTTTLAELNEAAARVQSDMHYEVFHNLVVELTRTSLEVKSLRRQIDSLSGRLEFNERRTRAVESLAVFKASGDDGMRNSQDSSGSQIAQSPQPSRSSRSTQSSRGSQGPRGWQNAQGSKGSRGVQAPQDSRNSRGPSGSTDAESLASAPAEPQAPAAEPVPVISAVPPIARPPTDDGPSQRSRRRRRRRGRRGGGSALLTPGGSPTARRGDQIIPQSASDPEFGDDEPDTATAESQEPRATQGDAPEHGSTGDPKSSEP